MGCFISIRWWSISMPLLSNFEFSINGNKAFPILHILSSTTRFFDLSILPELVWDLRWQLSIEGCWRKIQSLYINLLISSLDLAECLGSLLSDPAMRKGVALCVSVDTVVSFVVSECTRTVSGILECMHWYFGRIAVYSYVSKESLSGASFGITLVVPWESVASCLSILKAVGSVRIQIAGGSCGMLLSSLWRLFGDLGYTPKKKSHAWPYELNPLQKQPKKKYWVKGKYRLGSKTNIRHIHLCHSWQHNTAFLMFLLRDFDGDFVAQSRRSITYCQRMEFVK